MLRGQNYIVTGGSQGIGRAIGQELCRLGARIYICDIKPPQMNDPLWETYFNKEQAIFLHTDLAQEGSILEAVTKIKSAVSRINGFVSNARPFLESAEPEKFTSGYTVAQNVFVKGPLQILELILPELKAAKGAAVVFIGSSNSKLICQQSAAYHIAKAALAQASRYLAYHLAPYDISVNTVSPGLVNISDRATPIMDNEAMAPIVAACTPNGRAVNDSEIGKMVAFLCSRQVPILSGQDIVLDGSTEHGDHFYLLKKYIDQRKS